MKTSAHTRRDPQKGKKEFSTSKGFTLIELMVVIAVIAIITSFALPSYQTLIEKRNLSSGAHQFSAFFSAAKMEAIKRNEMIAIYTDLENICMGFFVYDRDLDIPITECVCSEGVLPDDDQACAIDEFGDGGMALRVLNGSNVGMPIEIGTGESNSPLKISGVLIEGRDDDLVIFDPIRGMLVLNEAIPPGRPPLELQMLSQKDTYGLNVQLTATGRVTVCSDSSTAEIDVPGFDECEVIE